MPQTKKENVLDEVSGIAVADPYRWLENADDPEVKEWVKRQNEQIDSTLRNDSFEKFSNELAKNLSITQFNIPVLYGGRYFYTERQPDEDQYALYMKKGLDSAPIKLVDPNGKRIGNTTSIDYWFPSHSGKYVAYGISEGGDEMATLYVKDTDANQDLPDTIVRCRYASINWLPDDSAFFYTRYPRPGAVAEHEEHLHQKVYCHMLGDDPDNDELIFGEGRPKDDMPNLVSSPDGRYLGITVFRSWIENEVYIYDRETKKVKQLFVDVRAIFQILFVKQNVLLYTSYQANNFRVLSTTYDGLYKPLDAWEVFIDEKEFVLESIWVTKDTILAEYLINACSEVVVFDHDGKELRKLPLPPYASIAGISARREEEEFFYGITTFLFPMIVHRYDPQSRQFSEYRRIENPINPEDYVVKQEWYTSIDGTAVPLFLFHKKNIVLDGSNPTILSGYGGFGNSESPGFMRNWVPWIERGGIFAIANIRGGGEFGDTWHKAGIKEHKQNSFDDFICAAEHLISMKYTSSERIGIFGASNGGLLVSAVAVQRPDLFKAICAKVPLTDMVRFSKFGMAIRWIHEYGNPENEVDLRRILTWSPYHNVKEGIE